MKTAVIGGDKRMLFAAKSFLQDGHEVCVAGFDHLTSLCDIRVTTVDFAAAWADIIVLPVRPDDGEMLFAPMMKRKINLRELMAKIGQRPVFSGCAERILPHAYGRVYDYGAREDFTWRNAQLTAEGAISLLLSEYEGSVYGSSILVTGFGRIGKLLSAALHDLGADVTVAARRLSDRSMLRLNGMKAVDYPIPDVGSFDVVINTVPAPVLNAGQVDNMRENVFLIDLASKPGGIDFDRARQRELTCIHALSLPGRTAPLAAGYIIKDTIIQMIKEENGGKDQTGLCADRLLLHL